MSLLATPPCTRLLCSSMYIIVLCGCDFSHHFQVRRPWFKTLILFQNLAVKRKDMSSGKQMGSLTGAIRKTSSFRSHPPGPGAGSASSTLPAVLCGRSLDTSCGDYDVVLTETRDILHPAPMDDNDDDGIEDCVIFEQSDLSNLAFPVMADLRREGLLCDVTIKLEKSSSEMESELIQFYVWSPFRGI